MVPSRRIRRLRAPRQRPIIRDAVPRLLVVVEGLGSHFEELLVEIPVVAFGREPGECQQVEDAAPGGGFGGGGAAGLQLVCDGGVHAIQALWEAGSGAGGWRT